MLISSGNEGQSGQDNFGSWFIILFASFVGWLVATAFLELYSTVVDTIAMCFMEDKKYNTGGVRATTASLLSHVHNSTGCLDTQTSFGALAGRKRAGSRS